MNMVDSYIGFDLGKWDHQIKGHMLEDKTWEQIYISESKADGWGAGVVW